MIQLNNCQSISHIMKTIKMTLPIALLVSLLLPVSAGAQQTQAGKSREATATVGKVNPHITEAIRQFREDAPGHSRMPSAAIPVRSGDKILVDLTCTVSDALRSQVTKMGGELYDSPDPAHIIRVMMPLKQMEALASRSDVVSIVPAQLSVTNGSKSR
jgi:hypothetical protein